MVCFSSNSGQVIRVARGSYQVIDRRGRVRYRINYAPGDDLLALEIAYQRWSDLPKKGT
jgi:hypothetical protein